MAYVHAGERGRSDLEGKYVKYTAIGVYLEEDKATSSLAAKWKGKSAIELADSVDFFRDIITGNNLILYVTHIIKKTYIFELHIFRFIFII